jgi:hypothetical protein
MAATPVDSFVLLPPNIARPQSQRTLSAADALLTSSMGEEPLAAGHKVKPSTVPHQCRCQHGVDDEEGSVGKERPCHTELRQRDKLAERIDL